MFPRNLRNASLPALTLFASALAAPVARAQEDLPAAPPANKVADASTGDDASHAIKLPNFYGLSGMRDMFDARTPEGLTIRGGVRLQQSKTELRGHLMELDREKLDLQAYAGVALFSFVEAGVRLPFEYNRETKGFRFDGHDRDSETGIGNLDIAGKISIPIGPITLAPYAKGSLPTADPKFGRKSGGAIGAATTAVLLDQRLAFHANVDGGWFEGGWTSIDYRFGVSFVPLATEVILVRPYVYLDGRQLLEKNAGSDLRVAAGVQALLFDFVTLEAGGDYRFLSEADAPGLDRDQGTWRFEIGAGVAF